MLKHCKNLYNNQRVASRVIQTPVMFEDECRREQSRIRNIMETYDSQANLKLAAQSKVINKMLYGDNPPKQESPNTNTNTNNSNNTKPNTVLYPNARHSTSTVNDCPKHTLKSISIDNDFKKYIDHIRATFKPEQNQQQQGLLNQNQQKTSQLGSELHKKISNSHHHIYSSDSSGTNVKAWVMR